MLVPVATRVHVALLQHVREARRRVGTCRMVHLGLAGSELLVGAAFDAHPRVRALAAQPDTAVLFPGPGALAPGSVRPRTLIVVDGTWSEARKLLERSPVLRVLPRIGLDVEVPGRYRFRREPAPHCLATVEAVVQVLAQLDGPAERYTGLLAAFERMVTAQLVYGERRLTSRAPGVTDEATQTGKGRGCEALAAPQL